MVDQSFPISEKHRRQYIESEAPSPKRTFKNVFKSAEMRESSHSFPRRKNVFDLSSQSEKKNQEKKKKESCNTCVPLQEGMKSDQDIPLIELSSFSTNLSVQMQELIEKMADHIFIESENGISTTTVVIDTENHLSLFNGSKIIIEHYDTAPHSFNLQLSGSMQAIDEFTLYLPTLQAQLTEKLAGFQVELLPPVLTQREELRPAYTRKSKRGKKDEKIKKIPS